MAACRRLLLQCDWDVCLRENHGRAWVALQDLSETSAKPTVRGQLVTQSIAAPGLPNVVGNNGFSVKRIQGQKIDICYSDECSSQPSNFMTFLSPLKSFPAIHDPNKSLLGLDVSTGGLGVSSSTDGTLKVWQTDTGEVRRNLTGHSGEVNTCRIFPSGIVVLSGSADMQLKVWAADTGNCAATFVGHKSGVLDTAIIERGRNVVSCSSDGTAKLWDCSQQVCLSTFEGMAGSVNSCAIGVTDNSIQLGQCDQPPSEKEVLTEGKMLLMACESKSLLSYGLQTRKKIFHYKCSDAVNCCAFLSGTMVVCGAQNGKLDIIDLRNYSVSFKEVKVTKSAITSILPYKEGFLVSSRDGTCCYVNKQFNSTLNLSGPDCDPVYRMACDKTFIFTASRDGFIRKYNPN
ncbi:proteasomal ATPase-associated factor 1-like [Octopus vulgaris]|uniref:Proteasomal ATPase-associated factor 1-like n=2 Tax=Octopus vulgaris TaxID=6645 RepID=A0AA36EZA9_OCTVU|nr:proteasomal ATPase-associated factor 1-like [Octopus vulgaris]